MSGIVGIINIDGAVADRDLLCHMTTFLSYRGPDAQQIWTDGHVGFGHAMLRTTDEHIYERQPFTLDGDVWIIADARVDGRSDLKEKLKSTIGLNLNAATDVELILRAYLEWDTDCVDQLIGDFAFAIWDPRKQRLFCARDHFGVKPFFYSRVGNNLIFSNTLNCLRVHPAVSSQLNETAIGDFLLCALNQDPATTVFEDINRIPPGSHLVWSVGDVRITRYWTLRPTKEITYRRTSTYLENFTELLHTAVDDRLRTNRVAVSMSGGLDSTTIAATAKRIFSKRDQPYELRAFTVVCDRLIPDRERHYSRIAADALGIPIHYIVADDYELLEQTERTELREPEPFNVEPLPKLGADLMSQIASHGRVSLTGWDGDTLMCESPRFYFGRLARSFHLIRLFESIAQYVRTKKAVPPIGLRTWLKRKLGKYPVPTLYPSWVDQSFATRVNLVDRWRELNAESPATHPTRPKAVELLAGSNWWCLFENADPGVSTVPVEIRHPLMDIRLVKYLLAIPPVPWCIDKHILRESVRGLLPEEIRQRPKTAAAGNLSLERAREVAPDWLNSQDALGELSNFVAIDKIPHMSADLGSANWWLNIRLHSLNRWLKGIGRVASTQLETIRTIPSAVGK